MRSWRLDDRSKQKYAMAERFGLTEELTRVGWPGISAKDSGRIGGSLHGKAHKTS